MKSIPRLLRLMKPYRFQVALGWLLMAGLVAADLAIPRMLQAAIDRGIAQGDAGVIVRSALVIVGLVALSAAAMAGITVFAVRISQNLAADIRRDMFAQLLSFSFGNFDHLQTGQLMTRLTSDVSQIAQFVFMTMRMFVRVPFVLIGSLILMIATNWQLALMMVVLIPATSLVFIYYANKAQPLYMKVQRQMDRLNTVFQENLAGVRVVKAFVRAQHENERFGAANVGFADDSIRAGRFLAVLMPILRYLVNLGIVVVIAAGGVLAVRGALSVGQIVAFNSYLLWMMMALGHLGTMANLISSSDASAQRIFQILDEAPQVADAPTARALAAGKGRLAMTHVAFGYDSGHQEAVLQDINLVMQPGETIALLGATGSGKSSLVNLIPRFYDAHKGSVTVDDVDVREVTLDSLRAQMALAPQETILFSGTIRDNIRYGRPDAPDQEVIAAAQAAQAHEFIMGFAEGYDTLLGQRGVNLSGGQKQRLALARALLVNPRILILDDSTSSVDVATEVKIRAALQQLKAGRTIVTVAQRISSALSADKIVVLDRGRIAAMGNHQELMASSEIYREIYQPQLGSNVGATPHG